MLFRTKSLIVLSLALLSAATAAARKWTDDTGRFSIDAEFVSVSGDKVTLRKPDGTVIELSAARLSKADRDFVESTRTSKPIASAQDPFTAGSSNAKSPSSGKGPSSDKGEPIREVVATGVGLTADEALKASFAAAIEQSVGLFVDAQTVIQNDEIIKSRILTASSAFIDHYDVLKRGQENGLHQCRIVARVKMRKLQEVVTENKIDFSAVPGTDLAATLLTIEKSNSDIASVIVDLIRELPDKVIRAKVSGPTKALSGDNEETARLRIPITISVDQAAYATSIRDLIARSDKLALSKFSSNCNLPLQKPSTRELPIDSSSGIWKRMGLEIGTQNSLEPILYPPSHMLVPDVWYGIFDPYYDHYSREVRQPTNDAIRARVGSTMADANRAFSGGVDKVRALQSKRQESLAALVVAQEVNTSGNLSVLTYAFPKSVLDAVDPHLHSQVTLKIELTDAADGIVESAAVEAHTSGYSAGFVSSSYHYFDSGEVDNPKIVAISPGLRFASLERWDRGSVVNVQSPMTLVTQFAGHAYVVLPRSALEKVRGVRLKSTWALKNDRNN